MDLGDCADRFRFLIRPRDSKFTGAFDAAFTGADISTIRTPVRVPRANAIVERFIGTPRRELYPTAVGPLAAAMRPPAARLAEWLPHPDGHVLGVGARAGGPLEHRARKGRPVLPRHPLVLLGQLQA
jgi:putative transposase